MARAIWRGPDPGGQRIRVAPLQRRDAGAALARLARDPARNLVLIDLVHQLERRPRREPRPELWAALEDGALAGIAATRPTTTVEAGVRGAVLDALAERLAASASGLVRSPQDLAERIWERLARRRRRPVLDRLETAYRVAPARVPPPPPVPGLALRPAGRADLDALVAAARASLREEGRPDPFDGDPHGFRRWVADRTGRALVGTCAGAVVFVAYGDVQRPEGWLLQGVYTWPTHRGRGIATAGVAALCARAARAGADHVQLSVVQGNETAARLYERLGFEPFETLRTILYA